jgi:hypothetical protein
VGGISYRFDLPPSVDFEITRTEVGDDGIVTRIWQHALAEGGPYCYVNASEQAGFDGAFPESTQGIWRIAVRSVVRNDPIVPPPPGTRAALAQEGLITVTLEKDGSELPGRMFQRAYLTPDGTLVKLLASAPEESLAGCGTAAVVASLRMTGRTFTPGATQA